MSDMQTKQLHTYSKFIDAVKKNDVQQVAELLYEHAFLSALLEKNMPETTLTPYAFCNQNKGRAELEEILIALGATSKKEKPLSQEITPYQEIPLTQFVSSSSSFESSDIKLNNSASGDSLIEKQEKIIKKYHLDCIQKLYILTGIRPFTCDRTLNQHGKKGIHLRFMMPHLEKTSVEMILKLFNIPFNDGFGSTTHSYISILPEYYRTIDSYFCNPALQSNALDANLKSSNFCIDEFSPEKKVALFDILYSNKFLANLEHRNNNQYPLDTIMIFLTKFNMKNSFCFEYLEEKGHSFKHLEPLLNLATQQTSQVLQFSFNSPYSAKLIDPGAHVSEGEPATTIAKKRNVPTLDK